MSESDSKSEPEYSSAEFVSDLGGGADSIMHNLGALWDDLGTIWRQNHSVSKQVELEFLF